MSEPITIQSHAGPYTVSFHDRGISDLNAAIPENAHVVVDAAVAKLYGEHLAGVLASKSVLTIDAAEPSKSLERFPAYVEHLVANGVRRDHVLVAIGGGITQDITCFLAATLLRGVAWHFHPTTLLAQADSCIGSKSSINCGAAKNILGTFTPPKKVVINTEFLDTLDDRELRSGIGEILKVHAIEGPDSFDALAADYGRLFQDKAFTRAAIRRALEIKKTYIEQDEFDRDTRNVFNYGHSFGHAIEAATDFAVPHGIAVTIGMDMANTVAVGLGVTGAEHAARMHKVLRRNYRGFEQHPVAIDRFLAAIGKDKKNVGAGSVTLILPDGNAQMFKGVYANDETFRTLCADYLGSGRAA